MLLFFNDLHQDSGNYEGSNQGWVKDYTHWFVIDEVQCVLEMFQEKFAINEIEICLFHMKELLILYKKSKGVSGSTRPTKVNLSGVKFHR